MVRVRDLEGLAGFTEGLGLQGCGGMENTAGRTLVFLAADETPSAEVELT